MSSPDFDSFSWLSDHVWAPMSVVLAAGWTHLHGKFNKLEREKTDKDVFKEWVNGHELRFGEHMKRTEDAQKRAEETMDKMFDRLEKLRDEVLVGRGSHDTQ
jgi:hypothetical protein